MGMFRGLSRVTRREVTKGKLDSGAQEVQTQSLPPRAGVCVYARACVRKLPSIPLLLSLSRDPINLQVLQAFVDCHEFANLNLVQALR